MRYSTGPAGLLAGEELEKIEAEQIVLLVSVIVRVSEGVVLVPWTLWMSTPILRLSRTIRQPASRTVEALENLMLFGLHIVGGLLRLIVSPCEETLTPLAWGMVLG
jgi:hypothetical protein